MKKFFEYAKLFVICILVLNTAYSSENPLDQEIPTVYARMISVFDSSGNKLFHESIGNCNYSSPPNCTASIPLYVAAHNEDILTKNPDQNSKFKYLPVRKHDPSKPYDRPVLNQDHDPLMAAAHSHPDYFTMLYLLVGKEPTKKYFQEMNITNGDFTDWDLQKERPITVGGHLTTTLEQQHNFLVNLVLGKLSIDGNPVDKPVIKMISDLFYQEDLADGWKQFGKTGAQNCRNYDGEVNLDFKSGWFQGWMINKTTGVIIISSTFLQGHYNNFPSIEAKAEAKKYYIELAEKNPQWSQSQ